MNIIYRIYQLVSDIDRDIFMANKTIICQDVMMCNSKEDFKEAIRLTFGDDIKFKHTKGMKSGDIFCSIISYDCNNAEEYVRVDDFICDNCKRTFKTNPHGLIKSYANSWLERICKPLYEEKKNEIDNYHYCCYKCRQEHEEKLKEEFTNYAKENNWLSETWVYREDNFNTGNYGYIYLITKKSTGEFYVGQTNAVPMFRWVQHLKTERFNINNIIDYKYEILEVVKYKKDINNREAYWINKKYQENPSLSLNIMKPQFKPDNLFKVMECEEDE